MKNARTTYDTEARRLKALAHPARLRILARLLENECCAAEATKCLKASQPNTSQHLRALREAGFIAGRRQGTRICYRIADPRTAKLLACLLKGER